MSVKQISDRELKTVSDYQQLVDDIESLMASPVGVDAAHVGRLNADFEIAVKVINSRLRECDQLLKKGLRNEAIERSESQPKLIELFLIADFPERESWADTVRECGFTSTDLLVGVAAELTEAQATEKPLADLKYQVRVHALARSPLPIRIQLMRDLSKADKNTTVWEEDLKHFEFARHDQLSHEIQAAIKSADGEALTNISEELQSPEWLAPPKKGMLKQVSDALAQLRRQQARQQLRSLEPEMVAAFAAFDVQRGRDLREAWNRYNKVAGLIATDPLTQSVSPALNWLEEQDQQDREQSEYDDAVEDLKVALDEGGGRLGLEEKYNALMSFNRGIPEELNQRLEQRLQRIDAAKTRSLSLKIAGAFVALSIVLAVAFFTIRNASFRKEVQSQIAILQKYLEEKQFVPADEHLKKLETESPQVAADGEIQQIKSTLALKLIDDKARQTELEEHTDTIRSEVAKRDFRSMSKAEELLEKAQHLPHYPAEKSKFRELEQLVSETKTNLRQAAKGRINNELGKRKEEFTALKSAPQNNLESLQRLRKELSVLKEQVHQEGLSNDSTETQVQVTLDEVERSLQQGNRQKNEGELIQSISKSSDKKFFDDLKLYTDNPAFKGTPRFEDFKRVQSESLLIEGFQAWKVFLEDKMRADLATLNSSALKALRKEFERLEKAHPGFTYDTQVSDVIGYWDKKSDRENASPEMKILLDKQMFKAYSVWEGEKQYYISEIPDEKPGGTFIRYYRNKDFASVRPMRLEKPVHEANWYSALMAFEVEATKLLNKLQDQKGAGWEQIFLQILENLYNSPRMDPIIKVQLIEEVLAKSETGSPFLVKNLKNVKKLMDAENINITTNWIDPDDKAAPQVRTRCENLLKRMSGELGDLKPLMSKAEQFVEDLRHPRFDTAYAWTGCLLKDAENNWAFTRHAGPSVDSNNGDLFVLAKGEGGKVKFAPIGKVQQGEGILNPGSPDLVVEGRPYFVKKPDDRSTR